MAIDELAFAGYWFYESDQNQQDQATLFSSYGLIEDAPAPTVPTISEIEGLMRFGTGFSNA